MSLNEYFSAQHVNKESIARFEPFAILMPAIDELYNFAIRLKPTRFYGQCLLICHNSFLASASLIAQAQLEDAAPITRRAIEAARLAAAVKENPTNLKEWLAYEERLERWRARREGEKPKHLQISLKVEFQLVHDLMNMSGILSDAAVHFTPEYFANLDWEYRDHEVYLNYFQRDQRTITREIVILAGTHTKILEVLNWCLDNRFWSSPEWRSLMEESIRNGERFARMFESSPQGGRTEPPAHSL